jgi:hypothetical protein
MAESFLKALVTERHGLLPLIYEFNMRPARYIHGSWIDSIVSPSLFKELMKSLRAEKRLSDMILRRFHLDGEYFFDFEEPRRRLALIDGRHLARLTFLAGIAVNAPRFSKVIERDQLTALKEEIGEEAYLFALRKAPFLTGRMAFVFSEDQGSGGPRSHAIKCGMKCLGACFSADPEALIARLLLKLPEGLGREFDSRDPEIEGKHAWSLLRKVLLQEVEPGWAPYFS